MLEEKLNIEETINKTIFEKTSELTNNTKKVLENISEKVSEYTNVTNEKFN